MADKKLPEQGETRKELEALLDKLDEESLQFLKQQADILIYSGFAGRYGEHQRPISSSSLMLPGAI